MFAIKSNRFIRPKELQSITGLSRTSIWRLEKSGQLPPRRQISPGAVGWLHSEINEWLESRSVVQVTGLGGNSDEV